MDVGTRVARRLHDRVGHVGCHHRAPVHQRGMAIGLWGGITGLAVAAGPIVGGAVVQGISWHWIFWLNVPIGLVLIPLAALRLTESFGPRPRLDGPGLVLAGAGFLGMTWG